MLNKSKLKVQTRLRRKKHIRKKISGTLDRPRLCVYRSLKHIYAQLIDDTTGRTLTAASSVSKDLRQEVTTAKNKTEASKIVGKDLAQKAVKAGMKKVVFDRNGFLYHGRVKALAEGAREGGLEF